MGRTTDVEEHDALSAPAQQVAGRIELLDPTGGVRSAIGRIDISRAADPRPISWLNCPAPEPPLPQALSRDDRQMGHRPSLNELRPARSRRLKRWTVAHLPWLLRRSRVNVVLPFVASLYEARAAPEHARARLLAAVASDAPPAVPTAPSPPPMNPPGTPRSDSHRFGSRGSVGRRFWVSFNSRAGTSPAPAAGGPVKAGTASFSRIPALVTASKMQLRSWMQGWSVGAALGS